MVLGNQLGSSHDTCEAAVIIIKFNPSALSYLSGSELWGTEQAANPTLPWTLSLLFEQTRRQRKNKLSMQTEAKSTLEPHYNKWEVI